MDLLLKEKAAARRSGGEGHAPEGAAGHAQDRVDALVHKATVHQVHVMGEGLENEHVNNAGKFRSVKVIPLPFHEVEEDLIVWMRTAALLIFRKLYGRIYVDLKENDTITVRLSNNYNTYSFGGKKKLALSTAVNLLDLVYNGQFCLATFKGHAPMVPAEVLSELAPFVVLAEKLGRLAVQLVAGGGGIKSVKLTYASARAPDDLDTRLLHAMITKGLIEPISNA